MIPYPVSYPQYLQYPTSLSYTWQTMLYSIMNVIAILADIYLVLVVSTVLRLMNVLLAHSKPLVVH